MVYVFLLLWGNAVDFVLFGFVNDFSSVSFNYTTLLIVILFFLFFSIGVLGFESFDSVFSIILIFLLLLINICN
jgi:hypothetical protein